jgi:hypothetical protein
MVCVILARTFTFIENCSILLERDTSQFLQNNWRMLSLASAFVISLSNNGRGIF